MRKGMLAGISLVAGFVGGAATVKIGRKWLESATRKEVAFYRNCYHIMNQWMLLKQDGTSLEKYFEQKGYRSIAIYGMGRMGVMLYEDLKDSHIQVKYGIDQDISCTYSGLNIIQPEDTLDKVDVIIVTPFSIFDEIKELLSEKTDIPVVSIEEMIYEV